MQAERCDFLWDTHRGTAPPHEGHRIATDPNWDAVAFFNPACWAYDFWPLLSGRPRLLSARFADAMFARGTAAVEDFGLYGGKRGG